MRTGVSIATSWQYTLPRSEMNAKSGRFTWFSSGPWGPCSATCGGGVRRKQLLCQDELTRELVSRRKCSLSLKPSGHSEIEKCNVQRYAGLKFIFLVSSRNKRNFIRNELSVI